MVAIGTIAVASGLSTVLVVPVRAWAIRSGTVCIPNARSSHDALIPRAGGIAFVLAATAAWVLLAILLKSPALALITAIGAGVAAVGWIDDRGGVRARVRFSVHLVAGLAVAAVALYGTDIGGWRLVISCVLAAILIAWSTNLFNFMDGIDGLAASEGAFCAAAGAVVTAVTDGESVVVLALAAMSGALLGFLPWNAPRARIFMGDTGSTWIGFCLAAIAAWHGVRHPQAAPALLILPSLFVADATVCLVRRAYRGERLTAAHRSHAYQNLARKLGSHAKVVSIFAAGNALLACAAACTIMVPTAAWWIAAGVGIAAALAAIAARSGIDGVSDAAVTRERAAAR